VPEQRAPWNAQAAGGMAPSPGGETVVLPPQLVRALLLRGLSEPEGRALWAGYILGQEKAPWLLRGTFAISECSATVAHVAVQAVPGQAQPAASPPAASPPAASPPADRAAGAAGSPLRGGPVG
jgi:hypothetical protein